jgi:hypothetical protein
MIGGSGRVSQNCQFAWLTTAPTDAATVPWESPPGEGCLVLSVAQAQNPSDYYHEAAVRFPPLCLDVALLLGYIRTLWDHRHFAWLLFDTATAEQQPSAR